MKQYLCFLCLILSAIAGGQGSTVRLKDLAVPNSPAFVLVDVSPSVIQHAHVPKEFVLGIAQSFQNSSNGFPQDYSAQFTPYWWLKPGGRSVYSLLGLATAKEANKTIVKGEDHFSGLKLVSVSVAFINKDLIPDTSAVNQKIVSLGVKTTVFKVYAKNYATDLATHIDDWHTKALEELNNSEELQAELARNPEMPEAELKMKLFKNFDFTKTDKILKRINKIIQRKPLFSWDIAGAYAHYGIGDSAWRSGRYGAWTTVSSFLPLDIGGDGNSQHYLGLNLVARYLYDKYQLAKTGIAESNTCFDIGGKITLELDKFSIGVEALHRYNNGELGDQNRTVGVLNYKMADNLYLRGAFGKNFNAPDKLIALFGISWGFGTETIKLEE
ncbi:MAG TPA: hypothetical protein VFX58_18515 [Chitinophagaceae bacterium]|nr:hypothetical protein [Chitinophagaceae bacterium]